MVSLWDIRAPDSWKNLLSDLEEGTSYIEQSFSIFMNKLDFEDFEIERQPVSENSYTK